METIQFIEGIFNLVFGAVVVFVTAALIVILFTSLLNAITFPRLKPAPLPPMPYPHVFVLIPARNEAAVIAATIRALLAQHYPLFDIILLDDHSKDGTGEIARMTAAGSPRLHIIHGAPLPEGWIGKNWACQQLANVAMGHSRSPDDIFIFTDADVTWNPGALVALVDHMRRNHADLLTVWSTQITRTWGERLVVPLMALAILGYLPAVLVNRTNWSAFAAANGQCLAFRRRAYESLGGHHAVRDKITEDIAFARRLKARGMRLWMADGAGMLTCRMYHSWDETRNGFAKNIAAGYGGVFGLILGSIFHWLVFLLPPVWLFFGVLLTPVSAMASLGLPFILTLMGMGARAITAAATRQRVIDALLMPISVLAMSVIALQAIYWQVRYGGVRWKGRTIRV